MSSTCLVNCYAVHCVWNKTLESTVFSLLQLAFFYINLVLKSISMRSMLLTFALLMNAAWLFSQDDVFSNKTNMALEKVIRDYPNRFHNIRGEMISQHPTVAEYKSTITLPGANSSIWQYSVSSFEIYSWSCVTFNSKDFMQARVKFKEIYDQIDNTIFKVDGQKPFILHAQYRTPTELRSMNSISFELLPLIDVMKNLKIELILEKELNNWKVKLNVYDGDHKLTNSAAANIQ